MKNVICTSLWRVKLETYQNSLVTERKISDWSLSIIFVIDGSLQPLSSIADVCMDFIMHLCNRSLFSLDSLDLRQKGEDMSR
jgi:hypothetical protein